MSRAMTATTTRPRLRSVRRRPAASATLGPSVPAVAATCSLDMLPPHTGARQACRALAAPDRAVRPSVFEPGQEPGDQPVDPDGTDRGAAQEADDHENGDGPQLLVDPVPRKCTNQRGDQQKDADLREQGEIGSGLTRQSPRMIAATPEPG